MSKGGKGKGTFLVKTCNARSFARRGAGRLAFSI